MNALPGHRRALIDDFPFFVPRPELRSYGSDGVFQTLTVPSKLAEASHCPSGLNATPVTQLVWPCSVWISLVPIFQSRTVESVPPQASTVRFLGWNATLCTAAV